VPGSLILGGYDASRHSKWIIQVPMSDSAVTVGVQSIFSILPDGTITKFLRNGINTTIDTSTSDILLPLSACDAIASTFGLTYIAAADRYIVSNASRAALQASSPTFSFVMGTAASGGSTVTIDLPYAAFDLQAGPPFFGEPTYYFPLRRAGDESQYTLGRAFLQEVYLSVDWERDVFKISQAVFNSTPLPQGIVSIEPVNKTTQSGSSPAQSPKALSAGVITGVAIGAVALITLLVGITWWYHHRKKRAKREPKVLQDSSSEEFIKAELGANNIHEKPLTEVRSRIELDGQTVEEPDAPHGVQEFPSHQMSAADATPPIYELPTMPHERT
jgi:hypothetical protein